MRAHVSCCEPCAQFCCSRKRTLVVITSDDENNPRVRDDDDATFLRKKKDESWQTQFLRAARCGLPSLRLIADEMNESEASGWSDMSHKVAHYAHILRQDTKNDSCTQVQGRVKQISSRPPLGQAPSSTRSPPTFVWSFTFWPFSSSSPSHRGPPDIGLRRESGKLHRRRIKTVILQFCVPHRGRSTIFLWNTPLNAIGWTHPVGDHVRGVVCDTVLGENVGDFLEAGCDKDHIFSTALSKLKGTFQWRTWNEDNFILTGIEIATLPDGGFHLQKQNFVDQLCSRADTDKKTPGELTQLRGVSGSANWLGNQTRPDLCVSTSLRCTCISNGG